jgi:carbonic anhydrase
VKHIVGFKNNNNLVCGHYGCGGVERSLHNTDLGLIGKIFYSN